MVAGALDGAPIFRTLVIILISIGGVGVLVLAWSVPVDDGMRNRLRTVWSPGDPVPPTTDARRKTSRVRDAGGDWADGIDRRDHGDD